MIQRSTAKHCQIDIPFCTKRKSYVTWNFTVPVNHSEEIRRSILLFLCTLGVAQDIIMSWTWYPLRLNRGSCRHPLHSPLWCGTYVATIAGSTFVMSIFKSRNGIVPIFSTYCLNEVRSEIFLANDSLRKGNRHQEKAPFEDTLTETVQFELNVLHLLLSFIQPLFSLKIVHCFVYLSAGILFAVFFFFFQEKAFYQFCFFPHQFWTPKVVLDIFLSDQNI